MEISKNNVRMIIVNEADDATISQSIGTAFSTLPLTHVQLYSNSRVFRSPDINQVQFSLTWTVPKILSGFALWRHNMSSSSTWRIEVFADQAMTQLMYDSNTLQAVEQKAIGELDWLIDPLVSAAVESRYQSSDHWFDDIAAQAVRVTINDPDNEKGFIDITRIYVGRAIQPAINFSYGHSFGWLSQAQAKRTAGGTRFNKKEARPRKVGFSLDYISEQDRPHFVNAINKTGDDTDWYISMFPALGGQKERHYAFACMFTTLPTFTGSNNNTFSSGYEIEEA